MRNITFSALLAAALALPASAIAALEMKDAAASPEQASNPKPEAHDILLPMPCGLQMALRAVAVPGKLLQDRRFTMGLGATEEERQLYERRFEAHIAAPFTPADLPEDWQARLDEGTTDGYTFYFLGKYEVSVYQWDAVMNGTCPAEDPVGGDLPRREISWFDAQDFLRKYNAWLVANHPDSLPHFADNPRNIGFLRLPTEEEWEFAARGGAKVRQEDRDNNDIFPLEGGKLADFGVFSDQVPVHEPSAIGSRKPNPLGLHDTVGNVKEMVDGFFRFSVAEMRVDGEVYQRLHGASGGVLCKGGGFRGKEREVLPGWRDEVPLYTAAGESRPSDLGLRVALSGLNVPSGQRLRALIQENAGGPAPVAEPAPEAQPTGAVETFTVNPKADPLNELKRLTDAAPPELQDDLGQLHSMLSDRQSAQERQRVEVLENSAKALLYQAETIRGFAFRYVTLKKNMQSLGELKAEDKKQVEQRLDEYYQLLLTAANYYKTTLARVSGGSQAELDRIMGMFRQEYGGEDSLNRHMRQNIDTVEKHLKAVRAQGIDKLGQKQVCRDIIPDLHLKVLPL